MLHRSCGLVSILDALSARASKAAIAKLIYSVLQSLELSKYLSQNVRLVSNIASCHRANLQTRPRQKSEIQMRCIFGEILEGKTACACRRMGVGCGLDWFV